MAQAGEYVCGVRVGVRFVIDQDELALLDKEDKLLHVLFSSIPDDLGLYDKPMARNAQIWAPDGALLLDGPGATPDQLKQAMHKVQAGSVLPSADEARR